MAHINKKPFINLPFFLSSIGIVYIVHTWIQSKWKSNKVIQIDIRKVDQERAWTRHHSPNDAASQDLSSVPLMRRHSSLVIDELVAVYKETMWYVAKCAIMNACYLCLIWIFYVTVSRSLWYSITNSNVRHHCHSSILWLCSFNLLHKSKKTTCRKSTRIPIVPQKVARVSLGDPENG